MGKRGRKRTEETYPEIMELLGVLPDQHIAESLGVSRQTVVNCRKRHNIDPVYVSDRACKPQGQRANLNEALRQLKVLSQRRSGEGPRESEMVVVVFRSYEEGRVDVLHGHDGIRVYHKDNVDWRVMLGGALPLFHSWFECRDYLEAEGYGEFRPCLLSLPEAQKFLGVSYSTYSGPPETAAADAHQKVREAAEAGKKVVLSAAEAAALVGL